MSGDVVQLNDFDVIAIRGDGVWVTDGENCWHVGGPHPDASTDRNALVAAYRSAFE